MLKVAVFDTKQYDVAGFEKYGKENDINFKFFDTKLTEDTVGLARGCNAVVVFVNDTVNEKVIMTIFLITLFTLSKFFAPKL